MSLINEVFTAKPFLPVEVSTDGMELLEQSTGNRHVNGPLFIAIGEDRNSTTGSMVELLDTHFPELLDTAFDEQCEFISFYL